MIIGDDFQHQVNGRCPTGRRHPATVYDEDRFCQFDFCKFFAETILIFPVNCGPSAIKDTCFCHCVGSRTQPAHGKTFARFTSHPIENPFGCV